MKFKPAFVRSYQNGSLQEKAGKALSLLGSCSICPRKCKVNRIKGGQGFCSTGINAKVYSFMPHHGEEPPISGQNGSGAVFFSNCNMNCVYCQNFEFSQSGKGKDLNVQGLADIMLKLQEDGCHNINLITPTHVVPQIIEALLAAAKKGLNIPICYNTSGYELPETIRLLEGIVDIYLADMRYSADEEAVRYSAAPGYSYYNKESVKEMYCQVGNAKINNDGILESGLIIRHLVLPNSIAGTGKTMEFISRELSDEVYVSLMSQYLPCYKAGSIKEICRRVTLDEYEQAKNDMERFGLYNGWVQDSGGLERFAGTNIKQNL